MVTVGYGDITPTNSREKVFVIILMVLACGVFAYSLNRVGVIIQEMFQKEDEFRFKIKKLKYYENKYLTNKLIIIKK